MKYFLVCSLVCTLFVLNTGCEWIASSKSTNKALITDSTLVGPRWNLVSYQQENSGKADPGTVGIYIQFKEDSSVTGRSFQKGEGPCASNSFQGQYEILSGNNISIEISTTTKVGEPEGSRYMEFVYEIDDIGSFEIRSNKLLLFKGGQKLMELKK